MKVLDVLQNTGQCQDFRDKFVSKAVAYDVVQAALWASFPHGVMNLEFVVVRDKEKIALIAEQCPRQSWLAKVPCVLVIINDSKKSETLYGDRGKLYATQSLGAAMQAMMMSLQDSGLAGYWVRSFNENAVARIIKKEKVVEALLVIGYPKKKVSHEEPNIQPEKVMHFDVYGNKEVKE
ncbi:MAG TPA: nitroreductase family protein [Candidatus Nanoarchaeia archaeon]|nr:nitroreductase family protein [Candidatus Nanoarchaeia archaeon]